MILCKDVRGSMESVLINKILFSLVSTISKCFCDSWAFIVISVGFDRSMRNDKDDHSLETQNLSRSEHVLISWYIQLSKMTSVELFSSEFQRKQFFHDFLYFVSSRGTRSNLSQRRSCSFKDLFLLARLHETVFARSLYLKPYGLTEIQLWGYPQSWIFVRPLWHSAVVWAEDTLQVHPKSSE